MVVAPRSTRIESNVLWNPNELHKSASHAGPVVAVAEMLHDILERYCVDRHRVFTVGYLGDAEGPVRLACEFPMTAIASVSGLARNPSAICPRGFAYRMPYLRFNPGRGQHVPLFGGEDCGGDRRAQGTLNELDESWAEGLECKKTQDPPFREDGGAQRRVWDCKNGRLESRIVDGGAVWPGVEHPGVDPDCVGPQPEIDYAAQIWTFFEEAQDRPL